MKRSITLLAAGVMLLGLVSCGSASNAEVTYNFTVSALGEGGKKGITVGLVDASGKMVVSGVTARGGTVSMTAKKGDYSVVASDLPAGYYQTEEVKIGDESDYTVNLCTKLIEGTPDAKSTFYRGDVLYDHSFNMVDGTTTSISEELKEHDVCIINFWGIQCGVCCMELPELDAYYREVKDEGKVGLICVNSYSGDTNDQITAFMEENKYIVPSTVYDTAYSNEMNISGWPTTVIVDRYGRYAGGMIGFTKGVEDFFHKMVDKFIGDTYVPQY